jgi:hypothetical protein
VIATETPCRSCGRPTHADVFCRACGTPLVLIGAEPTPDRPAAPAVVRQPRGRARRRTIVLLSLAALAIPAFGALVIRSADQGPPPPRDVVAAAATAHHPADRVDDVVFTPDGRTAGVVVSDGLHRRLVVLVRRGNAWDVRERAAHPPCGSAPRAIFSATGITCA